MDARNFTFMFYGFLAAWLIVLLYVISLARRGTRLNKELENVKQLLSSNQKSQSPFEPGAQPKGREAVR